MNLLQLTSTCVILRYLRLTSLLMNLSPPLRLLSVLTFPLNCMVPVPLPDDDVAVGMVDMVAGQCRSAAREAVQAAMGVIGNLLPLAMFEGIKDRVVAVSRRWQDGLADRVMKRMIERVKSCRPLGGITARDPRRAL
eukprot:UN3808